MGIFWSGARFLRKKTTINPDKLGRGATRRLVAHVAVDVEDCSRIAEVAIPLLPHQRGAVGQGLSRWELGTQQFWDQDRDAGASACGAGSGVELEAGVAACWDV